jgi:hypothetical protein
MTSIIKVCGDQKIYILSDGTKLKFEDKDAWVAAQKKRNKDFTVDLSVLDSSIKKKRSK